MKFRSTFAQLLAVASLGLITGSAMAATATGNLNVSAVVADYCELGTTSVSLNLGSYVPTAQSSMSAAIQVRCTVGTAANVGLGYGSNASGTNRRLKHATDSTVFLSYELYKPDGTTIWQAPGEAGVVTFTGNGSSQGFNVTGKIPSNQWSIKTGNYSDTVLITVTFPEP
ncbi:Spore Coat Protein U domain protein [Limnobacter sp. 130]|uniref:Csu type fimbrial protein n=1 Tax=Limnobacter sp. 130 TaxID=2653147 RepID=UPI0012F1B5E6|nr:spore coat U domain-containing protein [Limnobacter sp. 130]VWX37430.1 Spore Coat Protein U domain protein [Limnobacter sp. 130]